MAAADFTSDPVIVSGNRRRDIGSYVKKLFDDDSLRWGSIWPWEFPQEGTKDQEEIFLRECFGEREIHMQGGAGGKGHGFRFLKQAWYSAAIYNFKTRVPLTVQWWFDTNQELWREPTMAEFFFKPDVELSTFFLDPQIKLFGAKFLKVVVNEIQKKLITVLAEIPKSASLSVENTAPVVLSPPVQEKSEVETKSGEHLDVQEKTVTLDQPQVIHQTLESQKLSSPKGLGLTTDVVEVSEQPVSPKTDPRPNPGTENRPPTSVATYQMPRTLTAFDANAQVFRTPRQTPGYAPNTRPSVPFQGYGSEMHQHRKNENARRQSDHSRRNTSWAGHRQDSSAYPPSFGMRPANDMTTSWLPGQPFNHEQLPHPHFAQKPATNTRQNTSFPRERRGSKHVMDPASFSRDLPAPPSSYDTSPRHNRGSDHRYFSQQNPSTIPWAKDENVHPRPWSNTNHGAGGYKNIPHPSSQHYIDYNQHPPTAQYPNQQPRTPFDGFLPMSQDRPWAAPSVSAEQRSGRNMPFDHHQQAYVSEVLPPPGLVPYMAMAVPPPHHLPHGKAVERHPSAADALPREEQKYVPPHKNPNLNLQKTRRLCGNGCNILRIGKGCDTATQLVAQNVPSTVTGELLQHMFSQYGPVHHIYRSAGVAFVDYEMSASAALCLFKQADLKNYVNNISVEVSRMHWDTRFLMSSQEARMKFLRSDLEDYDRLANWLAENRASQKNLLQAIDALPRKRAGGDPIRNRPEHVDGFTPPKKPKKGNNKKKPDRQPDVVGKPVHAPSQSPELSRKHESDFQANSKIGKKKTQQARRPSDQTGLSEAKSLPDHKSPSRAASEPPQPVKKSCGRESSPPEALVEETEPAAVEAEAALSETQSRGRESSPSEVMAEEFEPATVVAGATLSEEKSRGRESSPSEALMDETEPATVEAEPKGEQNEFQATPIAEKTDVESNVQAESPSQHALRKPPAATSDIDESIDISEPKTPDAGQALKILTSENVVHDMHSDKPGVTTPSLQSSDHAQITAQKYAEIAKVKEKDEPELVIEASQSESDPKNPENLKITTKTADSVQEIIPSSPSVDPTAGKAHDDRLGSASPMAKKDPSSSEPSRVVSCKKDNKPKGPPATESLSQFGRKNEKKSKLPKGKGSLRGKPKPTALDDATRPAASATSLDSVGEDAQGRKSSRTEPKDHPVPITSPADVKVEQDEQGADKTEAQRNDVGNSGAVKTAASWIPSLTGFLSKTRQSPKISPAAVEPPEKVIAEQKVASPKLEPVKTEQLSTAAQEESASNDSRAPSQEIEIIITRSSSPETTVGIEETCSVPEDYDRSAPGPQVQSNVTGAPMNDKSLLGADVAEQADIAGEQELKSDADGKSADDVGNEE
jgi:hypothetical protein